MMYMSKLQSVAKKYGCMECPAGSASLIIVKIIADSLSAKYINKKVQVTGDRDKLKIKQSCILLVTSY